ncbi:MAG TPA: sigma-70 family RNA polymerase sigma factor [Candidatus Polarisedimenticolaceae bacterium]|nr:sigma-70 family RNA polymerase sigma factor [Candidatus Polarisedimenticolaceae bacterium]
MTKPMTKYYDDYQASGSLAPRPTRRESDPDSRGAAPPSAQLLPIYLREMGQTPLLARDDEVRLARELQEARQAIARVMCKLPADCRRYVLDGDLGGPRAGYRWPLDRLERACKRLSAYARDHAESSIEPLLDEVRRDKRRLDDSRDALIVANLRLVTHIVKKYGNQGIPFMDLIQEGNIGLMKAVEKFEFERGYKFSTYAYWWIKQAISRAIADKARIIRIPVHITEKVKRLKKVSNELKETLGRQPTSKEIARKMRLSVKKVDEILGVVQDPQPLDTMGPEEEANGVLPFVADDKAVDPLERTLDHEITSKMRSALDVLDPREEEVIRMRYGIGRKMRHTLEEIGIVLNLSRERVRQIEAIALRKIEATEESQSLRGHLFSK